MGRPVGPPFPMARTHRPSLVRPAPQPALGGCPSDQVDFPGTRFSRSHRLAGRTHRGRLGCHPHPDPASRTADFRNKN